MAAPGGDVAQDKETDGAGRAAPGRPGYRSRAISRSASSANTRTRREPSFIAPRAAEHVNDLGQPSRRRSLFERMTGVARREPGEAAAPAPAREPVEPRLHGNPPPRVESPAARAMPENPPARAQPEPAPQKAKQASSEEEVLEIPAFLRRQAN